MKPVKMAGSAEPHLPDRELHGEDRAILALRFHFTPDADDPLLARLADIAQDTHHGSRDGARA